MDDNGQAFGTELSASELFEGAVVATWRDREGVEHLIGTLAARSMETVAPEVASLIESRIAGLWQRGWQPADVARLADRDLDTAGPLMVRRAIASQSRGYGELGERVAPEWMAQLRRVDAAPAADSGIPYLMELGPGWATTLHVAVRVTQWVTRLPSLPRLTDPPSEWREGITVASGSLPAGMLAKVRALLAKAESTTFDAEADAFTAKAQELMARHRIDNAVLRAGSPDPNSREGGDTPEGRRIWIEDPYANPKAVLLSSIADANDCRALWSKGLGFMTVFGFASELDAVEELFTSLLVQATAALRRAGSKHDGLGRSRTRSFRRSFLIAFAVRIGERLREAVDAVVESVSFETGTALVPILAARADAVAAVAQAMFPTTRGFAARASDSEGWHAGTVFANQADIASSSKPSAAPKQVRRSA